MALRSRRNPAESYPDQRKGIPGETRVRKATGLSGRTRPQGSGAVEMENTCN